MCGIYFYIVCETNFKLVVYLSNSIEAENTAELEEEIQKVDLPGFARYSIRP